MLKQKLICLTYLYFLYLLHWPGFRFLHPLILVLFWSPSSTCVRVCCFLYLTGSTSCNVSSLTPFLLQTASDSALLPAPEKHPLSTKSTGEPGSVKRTHTPALTHTHTLCVCECVCVPLSSFKLWRLLRAFWIFLFRSLTSWSAGESFELQIKFAETLRRGRMILLEDQLPLQWTHVSTQRSNT